MPGPSAPSPNCVCDATSAAASCALVAEPVAPAPAPGPKAPPSTCFCNAIFAVASCPPVAEPVPSAPVPGPKAPPSTCFCNATSAAASRAAAAESVAPCCSLSARASSAHACRRAASAMPFPDPSDADVAAPAPLESAAVASVAADAYCSKLSSSRQPAAPGAAPGVNPPDAVPAIEPPFDVLPCSAPSPPDDASPAAPDASCAGCCIGHSSASSAGVAVFFGASSRATDCDAAIESSAATSRSFRFALASVFVLSSSRSLSSRAVRTESRPSALVWPAGVPGASCACDFSSTSASNVRAPFVEAELEPDVDGDEERAGAGLVGPGTGPGETGRKSTALTMAASSQGGCYRFRFNVSTRTSSAVVMLRALA
jgi:hypothetical protein